MKEQYLPLCADVPMLQPETIEKMFAQHQENNALVTVLTTEI